MRVGFSSGGSPFRPVNVSSTLGQSTHVPVTSAMKWAWLTRSRAATRGVSRSARAHAGLLRPGSVPGVASEADQLGVEGVGGRHLQGHRIRVDQCFGRWRASGPGMRSARAANRSLTGLSGLMVSHWKGPAWSRLSAIGPDRAAHTDGQVNRDASPHTESPGPSLRRRPRLGARCWCGVLRVGAREGPTRTAAHSVPAVLAEQDHPGAQGVRWLSSDRAAGTGLTGTPTQANKRDILSLLRVLVPSVSVPDPCYRRQSPG